jgi:hypothetical protein
VLVKINLFKSVILKFNDFFGTCKCYGFFVMDSFLKDLND